jgi:hypothetical protein
VKSGTSTLEAALEGLPFVVAYRTHPATFWLARRLVQVDHVALANLVAGERVVPEFLQGEATPGKLAAAVRPLLEGGRERDRVLEGLRRVRGALGSPGAADRVAALAADVLLEKGGGSMNRKELQFNAVARLASGLVRILGRTFRVEVQGREHYEEFRRKGQPFVFVFWHSRLLPLLYLHRNQGIVCLTSEHRDGEYITRIMLRLGYGAARGSSTRGARGACVSSCVPPGAVRKSRSLRTGRWARHG